jgi:7,8-dihydro-6-hydroxymethylpterin-pyrophosphokinase
MPNLAQERAHLALADHHIKEAEERIAKQIGQKAELEAAGMDTKEKDRFLKLLVETLDLMHLHRRQILDALADCEAMMGRLHKPKLGQG